MTQRQSRRKKVEAQAEEQLVEEIVQAVAEVVADKVEPAEAIALPPHKKSTSPPPSGGAFMPRRGRAKSLSGRLRKTPLPPFAPNSPKLNLSWCTRFPFGRAVSPMTKSNGWPMARKSFSPMCPSAPWSITTGRKAFQLVSQSAFQLFS